MYLFSPLLRTRLNVIGYDIRQLARLERRFKRNAKAARKGLVSRRIPGTNKYEEVSHIHAPTSDQASSLYADAREFYILRKRLSREARACHLAHMFLTDKPYSLAEPKVYSWPNFDEVERMALGMALDTVDGREIAQKFAAWLSAAIEYLKAGGYVIGKPKKIRVTKHPEWAHGNRPEVAQNSLT